MDRELAYKPHENGLKPVQDTLYDHLPPSIERPDGLGERRKCPECARILRFPVWLPRDGFCTECERLVDWEVVGWL